MELENHCFVGNKLVTVVTQPQYDSKAAQSDITCFPQYATVSDN